MVDKTSQGDYKWGLDVQGHSLQVETWLKMKGGGFRQATLGHQGARWDGNEKFIRIIHWLSCFGYRIDNWGRWDVETRYIALALFMGVAN